MGLLHREQSIGESIREMLINVSLEERIEARYGDFTKHLQLGYIIVNIWFQ